MSYESYCAACTYLGERGDYNGKYWCDKKGENHYADDSKCYSFCEAYSRSGSSRENMFNYSREHKSSGCYLTTIMCKLLNYPDDNYYLNMLRNFRDNVMMKDSKNISLLFTYDVIGPIIAYNLENDENGKDIAMAMFSRYIVNSVSAIEQRKNEEAIRIYIAMTNTLSSNYGIDASIITPNVHVDVKNLGHGRIRKKVENNM